MGYCQQHFTEIQLDLSCLLFSRTAVYGEKRNHSCFFIFLCMQSPQDFMFLQDANICMLLYALFLFLHFFLLLKETVCKHALILMSSCVCGTAVESYVLHFETKMATEWVLAVCNALVELVLPQPTQNNFHLQCSEMLLVQSVTNATYNNFAETHISHSVLLLLYSQYDLASVN